MKRRLSLKKEHLVELTAADLAAVAGGDSGVPVTVTCDNICGLVPTLRQSCPC